MTRKKFFMGMLGILVFLGIAAGEVGAQGKTLVITGIKGHSGDVMAVLASNVNDMTGSMAAVAQGSISKNNLTFLLRDSKNEQKQWSGSGDYYIVLIFEGSGNAIYHYTKGGNTTVKYNINSATTTIKYDQFAADATIGSSSNSGNRKSGDSSKILSITGIKGHSGNVMAVLASDSKDLSGSMAAVAQSSISKNSLTFQLLQAGNEKYQWSGSGDYFVILIFLGSGNAIYYYTGGGKNAVMYNITDTTTTFKYEHFAASN